MLRQKEAKVKGTGCLAFLMFGLPIIIFLSAIIIGLAYYSISTYNKCQTLDNHIKLSWANVENAYQKRLDLIPNLLVTVKGYAEHEKTSLTGVTEARANATSVKIDTDNLTEENIRIFEQAQDKVSGSLSRLLASVESYPNLKADRNFIDLQNELKQIETEIITRRDIFNLEVENYNIYILKFPRNIFAKMYGFYVKGYFKATEGAGESPRLVF